MALLLLARMGSGYTRRVLPGRLRGDRRGSSARLAAALDRGGSTSARERDGGAARLRVRRRRAPALRADTAEVPRGGAGDGALDRGGPPRLLHLARRDAVLPRPRLPSRSSPSPSRRTTSSTAWGVPGGRVPVEAVARVFRVVPAAERAGAARRRVIDVGVDAFALLRGFHGPLMRWERDGGAPVRRWARWTNGDAASRRPDPGRARRRRRERPRLRGRGVPPVPVSVRVGGRGDRDDRGRPFVPGVSCLGPASALPAHGTRAVLEARIPRPQGPSDRVRRAGGPLGICLDCVTVEAALMPPRVRARGTVSRQPSRLSRCGTIPVCGPEPVGPRGGDA